MDFLISSTGQRLDPRKPTEVILHPGVGIQVDGQHLHGGPRGTRYAVPYHLALDLIGTGRAHYPTPADADATDTPIATTPVSRDPEPQSADPSPRRRR